MDRDHHISGSSVNLLTTTIPALTLESTIGHYFDLAQLPERCLLVCYPFAIVSAQLWQVYHPEDRMNGECSALLRGFAQHQKRFEDVGIALLGVSTQSPLIQRIVSAQLGISFPLMSDANRRFSNALGLPMTVGGRIPRMQPIGLDVMDGCIAQVFYPLEPDMSCAEAILDALAVAGENLC